jgi:HEAT repeat protein
VRLNRLWSTTDGAIEDLGDSSRSRRANAGAWIWGHGYDHFSADERRRLTDALQPVAEADPDPAARAQAIAALVELRVDGSVELALAALRDPDWGMRTIVAAEIAPTGDPRIVDALLDLLDDADTYVREAAIIGLDRQGDPRALGPLRAMRRSERSPPVKKRARRAIRALKKRARGTDPTG